MADDTFRTNQNKEWVELLVIHSPEWETEPGHIRPQTFMVSATNHQNNNRSGSVILTRNEAIALRDWLTEHLT